jgi:sensor histidine kinase YesM
MNPGTASRFEEQRSSLLLYLTLTQVGFVGLVFVLCIFVSHKIVGPLYKLSMYLKGIREGNPVTGLNFREGDQFPEIADEINETIEYFTNKTEEELDYLEEISTYIENIALVVPEDKKPVLEEIQKKIKEFQGVHSN